MALKLPPPPKIASQDPVFNRWLLELTSILAANGDIDPNTIAGYNALQAQVATNTTDIANLSSGVGGNTAAITALQNSVNTLFNDVTNINAQLTTLGARAQVFNGVSPPAAGLGNINDVFIDTVGKHIYVKTAVATWTLIV